MKPYEIAVACTNCHQLQYTYNWTINDQTEFAGFSTKGSYRNKLKIPANVFDEGNEYRINVEGNE